MRAAPPASKILVDGKIVGTGYLVRHPLPPGNRAIEALYSGVNGKTIRWGPETVKVKAGKETRLPKVVLKHATGGQE